MSGDREVIATRRRTRIMEPAEVEELERRAAQRRRENLKVALYALAGMITGAAAMSLLYWGGFFR